MTPVQRESVLTKMCEIYAEKIRYYSPEIAMSEALSLAERLIEANEAPEPEKFIPYARSANPSKHEAAMSIITQWLRFDVPRSTRALISSDLCHSLAHRMSFLGD